jgi:Rrf2 family protein
VELSCKSQYAILALLELAVHYHEAEPRQSRQIAEQYNIPDRYLEQLLATLRRGGLVRSQRGAKGGYFLAKEPWTITLFDVLACIEGTDVHKTHENPDPQTLETALVLDVWQEVHQNATAILKKYTLKDLCEKLDAQRQVNLMYYI